MTTTAIATKQPAELRIAASSLSRRMADLRVMPPTLQTEHIAMELATAAKQHIAAWHMLRDPAVKASYDAHRAAIRSWEPLGRPAEDALDLARAVIKQCERVKQQELDRQRHEREQLMLAADNGVPALSAPDPALGHVDGVSTTRIYKWTVTDTGAFLRWLADRPHLFYLIDIQPGALKTYLKATGGEPIDGLEITPDFELRTRGPE